MNLSSTGSYENECSLVTIQVKRNNGCETIEATETNISTLIICLEVSCGVGFPLQTVQSLSRL